MPQLPADFNVAFKLSSTTAADGLLLSTVFLSSLSADYRAMIVRREEAEEARKAAAVSRLRGSYQVEAKKRAMAGTDVSTYYIYA